jgi:hypothetical protein
MKQKLPAQKAGGLYKGKGCGLCFYAKHPGLAEAWSSPGNSGECVALFADLGNTAVFSRRFGGVGKWNISKKSMLASSLAGCGKSALSVIPIEVRNLSGF